MAFARRLTMLSAALSLALAGVASAQADPRAALQAALQMGSVSAGGLPAGWGGGPAGTVRADSVQVHSAPWAGRVQRDSASAGQFSTLTLRVPVTFKGQTVALNAWVRTQDVKSWAGMWLREDGPAGSVQFDNMQQRPIKGTTDWTRYTIQLPLDATAREIYLGLLLAGPGTAWLDDVELLVDGRPAWEAPPKVVFPAEGDHEFDPGSRVTLTALTPVQQANLVTLGKVWGFVKYHHTRIARGEVNWDYELFRVLPGVLQASDRAGANQAMAVWLTKLGDPPACSPCAQATAAPYLAADIGWIHDRALLGAELSQRLEAIYANRGTAGEQYYVGRVPGVGNPTFTNEAAYVRWRAPDAGYRLLALFRLWNITEYWFPYRNVVGEDWNRVLQEFVPRMAAASDSTAYRLTLMQLIARLQDTHANLWSDIALRPPAGPAVLPLILRFVEGKLVVSGYSDPVLGPATQLLRGDIVERIDGAPVDSLVVALRPYYADSNEPTRLRDIARYIGRGPLAPARLDVRRGKQLLKLSPERVSADKVERMAGLTHDLPGDAFQMLSDDVAYLKLSAVSAAAIPDYLKRAANAKVWVVDIRNYPKEFVVFSLGGHFVDHVTPFVHFTIGQLSNPGEFVLGEALSIPPLAPRFTGKVVVLVDEVTQSSAEYTTMALRAAGAVVVGSTTAGADGNISPIPLPGGASGMMSGIGVFYPDKRPTQRIGIVPDLEVKPTIAGIRDGRDEVLEAAVSKALGRRFTLPPRVATAPAS